MARQGKLLLAFAVALVIVLATYWVGRGNTASDGSAGGVLSTEDAALRYPYQQLSKAEKELYSALRDGIVTQQAQIALPHRVKRQTYERVYLLLGMQEPELFYLDEVYELSDVMTEAHMHYTQTASEIAAMQTELEAAADDILRLLSPAQSDMQRLLTIHDEIARRCQYDTAGTAAHGDDAYGCLVKGRAQCEGYAKAFLYVARRAKQNVMCVTGRSTQGGLHVWNLAEMDKAFVQIDVTWDDSESFQGAISHTYFAMPDALFTDHMADTTPFLPPDCTTEQQTTFWQKGWLVSQSASLPSQLAGWVNAQAASGSGIVEFQCKDAELLHTVSDALQNGGVLSEILQSVYGVPVYCVCMVDETRRIVSILLPKNR